ncbi:MAG: carbohydrate ABC transporter substrate-binding protein [Lachnospiraceae bacterium]
MKKRILAAFLALSMTVGLLTACGGGSTGKTSDDTSQSSGEELNIAIFQGGYSEAYWERVVEMFEESHEGVTVNMEISPTIADIIRPQIVAGNAPDFIALNDTAEDGLIASLIKEEGLLDITDVFDGDNYAGTGTLRDDIKDGLLESTKCAPYGDDKIYLAPFNTGPQGLVYNETYFTENNLELPVTWDDFFALQDKLPDDRALFTYQGLYPGYMEEMLWPAIASAGGMEAIEKIWHYEEGSFDNPVVLGVLENIAKISSGGYLLDGTVGMDHTESQSEMMMGASAFIVNGTWMENEMEDAPREDGFEFAMTPIPVENEDDERYIMDSCEQFSIPKDAKNPELAKEFLRFLYSDESVKAFAETSGSVYATKTAAELSKEYLSDSVYNMYSIYEESNTSSLIMSFDALPDNCKLNVSDEIFNPLTSVMNGEMTAKEWAESVENAFAQIRSDMEAAE